MLIAGYIGARIGTDTTATMDTRTGRTIAATIATDWWLRAVRLVGVTKRPRVKLNVSVPRTDWRPFAQGSQGIGLAVHDVRYWHIADTGLCAANVRYWG